MFLFFFNQFYFYFIELQITYSEALEILKVVKEESNQTNHPNNGNDNGDKNNHSILNNGKSAFELLQLEPEKNPIVTYNQALDQMLGGGVPLGKLTEFCGVPGIGKTQMGMQLATSVQLPKILDGAEGECIYIDTEGSFVIERVKEIAEAFSNHVSSLMEDASEYTLEKVLSRIYYYRIHDYVEQLALINMLPHLIQYQYPKVKLVVIDSITFHFRYDFEDLSKRTKILTSMAQKLMSLGEKFSVAVVIMNQMTTKVLSEKESSLIPALGETWGHICTNRIILYFQDDGRYAHLYKSPSKKADTVKYTITSEGIR